METGECGVGSQQQKCLEVVAVLICIKSNGKVNDYRGQKEENMLQLYLIPSRSLHDPKKKMKIQNRMRSNSNLLNFAEECICILLSCLAFLLTCEVIFLFPASPWNAI